MIVPPVHVGLLLQDITDNVCLGFYNIQFASPGGGCVVAHRDFSVLGLIKKLDDG